MYHYNRLQVEVEVTDENTLINRGIDQVIFDLDQQIDFLSSKADKLDYLIAIGSGVLTGMFDIFWVGKFDLMRGRDIASSKIDAFVVKVANMTGYKGDEIKKAVAHLEKYHIPSDSNTPDFGGGLQHHLRDFSHHPTLLGLMFSLLTQFTFKSYGTDVNGGFIPIDVTNSGMKYIGKNIPEKIYNGTIKWFFHLVSDMAGSNSTAGLSGGTGIPGPILSLAKELSVLPVFKQMSVDDFSFSQFLSKLFNGTYFMQRDTNGKIIKDSQLNFDLRGEIGLGIELTRQTLPVIANEAIVRSFYFIRRFASEIKRQKIDSFSQLELIDWDNVKPTNNPTVARMLSISTGVFTSLDVTGAVGSRKSWLNTNIIGVGRFAFAIGSDISWGLKLRDVKKIKEMYEDLQLYTYGVDDSHKYGSIGMKMNLEKLGLTREEVEILYNLEFYKVLSDIENTKSVVNNDVVRKLKRGWLEEWRKFIEIGFPDFVEVEGSEIKWYDKTDLVKKIALNNPEKPWFRLVLLETMIFEPYFPLGTEDNKKGKKVPSKKYKSLNSPINRYSRKDGDNFLNSFFEGSYYVDGYIDRLRGTYNKVLFEMREVMKGLLIGGSITAVIAITMILSAGMFAPKIAVMLVGSKFSGLSGAALTSASLAYLGGGAIALQGAGMAGGTIAIVGGGSILGITSGLTVGGAVGFASIYGKENVILNSAKLLVTLREIFLNDEHDVEYVKKVYDQYVKNIIEIETKLIELKSETFELDGAKKKTNLESIKKIEETLSAMRIARKNLKRFLEAFIVGLENS